MIFNDATPVLYSHDLIFQVSCKVTWLLYISSCSGQLAITEVIAYEVADQKEALSFTCDVCLARMK